MAVCEPVGGKGSDCGSPTIGEPVLHEAVMRAINQTITGKDVFFTTLRNNISAVLSESPEADLGDIDEQLDKLQKELLRLSSENVKYESVTDEIMRLRAAKQESLVKSAEQETIRQRMSEMAEFLKEQKGSIIEYDDNLARRLVERVTVYENRMTVAFRSGIEIDV